MCEDTLACDVQVAARQKPGTCRSVPSKRIDFEVPLADLNRIDVTPGDADAESASAARATSRIFIVENASTTAPTGKNCDGEIDYPK